MSNGHGSSAGAVAATAGDTASGGRRLVGCRAHGPSFRRSGSRSRKAVALGFDDGPGPDTGRILYALRAGHAHATFFEVGRNTVGHRR